MMLSSMNKSAFPMSFSGNSTDSFFAVANFMCGGSVFGLSIFFVRGSDSFL